MRESSRHPESTPSQPEEKHLNYPEATPVGDADAKDNAFSEMQPGKKFEIIESKIRHREALGREELLFLYECETDGRQPLWWEKEALANLRAGRNFDTDIPIVLGYLPEQIAKSVKDINNNTKAYAGPLEREIFNELPETVEYIVSKAFILPIRRYQLEVGVQNPDELIEQSKIDGIEIGEHKGEREKEILSKIAVSGTRREIKLIALPKSFFAYYIDKNPYYEHYNREINYADVYQVAQDIGLEPCPAEVAPALCMEIKDSPSSTSLVIGMKPTNGYVLKLREKRRIFSMDTSRRGLDSDLSLSFVFAEGDHEQPTEGGDNEIIDTKEAEVDALQKLKYINEFGTAYRGLTSGVVMRTEIILKDGALTCRWNYNSTGSLHDSKTLYEKDVKTVLSQVNLTNMIEHSFKYGLQFGDVPRNALEGKKSDILDAKTGREYRKKISDNKRPDARSVWFNMVGRGGPWGLKDHYWDKSGLTIVFKPPQKEVLGDQTPKLGEYKSTNWYDEQYLWNTLKEEFPDIQPDDPKIAELRADVESYVKVHKNAPSDMKEFLQRFTREGKTFVNQMEGFDLKYRIAPNKFQGIVINVEKFSDTFFMEDIMDDNEKGTSDKELYERFQTFYVLFKAGDEGAKKRHAEAVVKVMAKAMLRACKGRPERVVPIYDQDCNLLWPQHVSRDKIIEMTHTTVDDRDPFYHKP